MNQTVDVKEAPPRVGLYVKKDTRLALNVFAAQNEFTHDEAIRRLLNLPPRTGEPKQESAQEK